MNKKIVTCTDYEGNISFICDDTVITWLDRKYLTLRNLRFRTDGEILIHLQHICWKMVWNNTHPLYDSENAILKITELNNGGVWLHIEADSTSGELSIITELKIYYSDEMQCFKYHVEENIKANALYKWRSTMRSINGKDYVYFEYTDPYFYHITGPAVPVSGVWPGIWLPGQECEASKWRKRWSMFVYEREDGVYEGVRNNHSIWPFPYKMKHDGFIGIFDDAVGNPVYRLLGDTGDRTYCEQCWWGYDLHFCYWKECVQAASSGAGYAELKPGETDKAEYEIYALTPEQSRPIMDKMVMQPFAEGKLHDPFKTTDRPVYAAGVNTFNRRIDPEDMTSFTWVNVGKGASWEKKFGFDDNFSLKLYNPDNMVNTWSTRVGQEQFMETLEMGKSYKLSGWFNTGDSSAEGFRLLVRYGILLKPGIDTVENVKVENVNTKGEWEYFEYEVPPVPENTIWADIEFSLSGIGCVWIDKVEFSIKLKGDMTIEQRDIKSGRTKAKKPAGTKIDNGIYPGKFFTGW